MPVHVFHHHDGIVHHKADGQHHGQQGHEVDGEAADAHQHDYADHGERYGDNRNYHRPEGAHKQGNDHQHDNGGFDDGVDYLVDGFLNGNGTVINNVHLH